MAAAICAKALLFGVADSAVIYAAYTQKQAKDVVWAKLVSLNDKHKLGWVMRAHQGEITAPGGCQLRLVGISKRDEVEKIRGLRLAGVVFDEPALYSRHLPELIREVVSPALADLAGWTLFIGTPGPVPDEGAWHQISEGVVPDGQRVSLGLGFERFHWCVRDNTAFPRDVEEMLDEEKRDNGWDEDSPQFQIEWLARWVLNGASLVYQYDHAKNWRVETPGGFDQVTIGVDFGVVDPCAWVVLGTRANDPAVYAIHAEAHAGLMPDDASAVTAALVARFRPQRLVGDHGGLGKTYVETWNRRHAKEIGLYMLEAEKEGKLGAQRVLNGELAKSRFFVCPDASALMVEMTRLPYLDPSKRDEEHSGYPNHCCDAALYAFRAHPRPRVAEKAPEPTADELERAARMARAKRAAGAPLR